jgi:NAD(P)H-quinone oxidoreductase subunit 5
MPINLLNYLSLTPVSLILVALISLVSLTIYGFSKSYLMGDSEKSKFILKLSGLSISAIVFALSDNYFVLLLSLLVSNLILVQMMNHKADWQAAIESGKMALSYFLISFILLSFGFFILYLDNQTYSIRATTSPNFGLYFILLGAMVQSAIWPFHRWLLNSLNAPTPVSALMHAGLINGGGIILIKLAPIYFLNANLLSIIFIIGLISTMIGGFWKLIQTDIKRMLACSTLAQMGFMFMQCGLGFFSAALAHVCFHGLFKAYLFLSSGSTLKEKSQDEASLKTSFKTFAISTLIGVFGALSFILTSGRAYEVANSSIILLLMVWMVCTQLSVTIITYPYRRSALITYFQSTFFSGITGFLYGWVIEIVEGYVPEIVMVQPMNAYYIFGAIALLITWLIFMFRTSSIFLGSTWGKALYSQLYVKGLNGSLPNIRTIASQRKSYRHY